MKVTFCTVASGTYAEFTCDNAQLSVRLPNGIRRPASDLLQLAEDSERHAQAEMRRAARLRKAAEAVAAGNTDTRTY